MNEDTELPQDVLAAIRANRKIDAIKLLREQRNLGLKEAKDVVDAYIDSLPPGSGNRSQQTDHGTGRLVIAVLVVAAIYAAYKVFS